MLSNVIAKVEGDSIRWELIDFNSFSESVPAVQSDNRYPNINQRLTYVYVQVILLGLHWMYELKQDSCMVRIICNTLHTDYGIDRKRIVEEADLSQLIARIRKALGDNRETKQLKS